jgi:hypothetical protein
VRHASRIVGLVLVTLSIAASAAGQPHELVSVDPLQQPLPPLLHPFRADPSLEPPEARIVPRLWQRVAEVGPEGELSVIVLLGEPQIVAAASLDPEEREAARVAAIAHLALGFADRAQAIGLRDPRGLSHLPIVSGEIDAKDLPKLAADPSVEAIEANEIDYLTRVQGGNLIRAPQMRSTTGATGAGIGVAVVDSGVFPHQEFAGRYVVQGNVTNEPGDGTVDTVGHGTQAAGIILGSNGGMAPGARLWSLKVALSDGSTPAELVITALNGLFAERNNFGGLHLVNLSLGGGNFNSDCDASHPAYSAAVNQLVNAGIPVFAASGNEGSLNGINRPACISGAIAVGAVYDADIGPFLSSICPDLFTAADQITCYSNSGHPLDILAPSHCAHTPQPGGGYDTCFGGTSAASPYAAGVAALLLQARPNTTPAQLRTALRASGKPITDVNGITRNRIDAVDAYNLLAPSTGPCVPSATTLCLDNQPGDRRFRVEVAFSTSQGGGTSGQGRAIPLSSLGVNRGGLFWFFSADNPELLIKVLNGCGLNNRFWVFFSAGTNVGLSLTVTDTQLGNTYPFTNTDLTPVPTIHDTAALPCS